MTGESPCKNFCANCLEEAQSRSNSTAAIACAIAMDFAETIRYLREVSKSVKGTPDVYMVDLISNTLKFLKKYVCSLHLFGKINT
ncbi:hypothetical protein D0469_15665 [Peribacillus saganii]|uniref:Uncharacterized protein n=1 Tax=Peribacillus saganii TaxID=2303992 RepID=A0A372LLW9_9BACI|nr:hypothetical protein D0469_15665 [Peribacillus saganii]